MEKLIVKTAVKTVLVVVGLFVVAFAVFNFACPQHMATLSENMGHYSLAVQYAALRYSYTGDCEDLARCFDDGVLAESDNYIIKYATKLKEHEDFDEVCASRSKLYGSDYKRTVNTKLAVAKYKNKEMGDAVKVALEDCGEGRFEMGNAFMYLALSIKEAGDAEAAEILVGVLKGTSSISSNAAIAPTDETEIAYLNEIISEMEQVAKKS